MFNGITEDKLNKLGIYDLRRVARAFGVVSPTSKRRDVLISEILKIQSGEQKPVFNKKIGRPVKTMGEDEDIQYNVVIRGDKELESHLSAQPKEDNYLIFQQNLKDEEAPVDENTVEFKGILRKTNQKNYYLISSIKYKNNNFVVLDASQVEKYHLIEGDLLHGTASVHLDKGYAKVKEISEINGVIASENSYDLDFEPVIPNVILQQPDYKMGQSKVCVCKNLTAQLEYIAKQTAEFKKKGYKCIVLALEISIETKLKLDMIDGFTEITSFLDDSTTSSFDKINDLLNHANSLFYHKNNVVVFVLNMLDVISILDTHFQGTALQHSEQTSLYVRKIVAGSKAAKDSSISTICLLSEADAELKPNEVKIIEKYCGR